MNNPGYALFRSLPPTYERVLMAFSCALHDGRVCNRTAVHTFTNERLVYEVEIVGEDGRTQEVEVDANSGTITLDDECES